MRTKKNSGFSLIELLIVVAIILIIAAIAIPNLLRARITANETSAVGSLRTINTTALQYNNTYQSVPGAPAPACGFPPALANLGPGTPPTSATADLIDAVLAAGTKSGYIFTYTAGPPDTNGCPASYTVTGNPVTPGTTGQRYFFTDQSGVIRQNTTAPATIADSPIA